jgi:hypothetical protein
LPSILLVSHSDAQKRKRRYQKNYRVCKMMWCNKEHKELSIMCISIFLLHHFVDALSHETTQSLALLLNLCNNTWLASSNNWTIDSGAFAPIARCKGRWSLELLPHIHSFWVDFQVMFHHC